MGSAIIAGLGPGFVEALAWELAEEGHDLIFFARSEEYIREFAAEMREAGYEAIGVPTDISDPHQVVRGFEKARAEFGPVEVLAVTASADYGWGSLEELSPEEFRQAWEVYGFGTFLCAREAASDMRKNGTGTILVVGVTPRYAKGLAHGYVSSKAAKRGLTESLARELGPEVHVVHVAIDGFLLNPDIEAEFEPGPGDERFIDPESAAAVCMDVIEQDEGAWNSAIDLRAPRDELDQLLAEFT